MTYRALAVVVILFPFAGAQRVERGGISPKAGLPLVMGVLSKFHASGSLEYWGSCEPGRRLDFPKLRPKVADDPVVALREIFAGDPGMHVTREPNGFIRMVETDVPNDLLALRIGHISFKLDFGPSDVIYDPRDALRVILSTPEVVAFMKTHEIGPPFEVENANGGRSMPSPLLSHISGDLKNVTLSQALDHVLQTFPGLWIYENCPSKKRKRAVDFAIYPNSSAWPLLGRATGP